MKLKVTKKVDNLAIDYIALDEDGKERRLVIEPGSPLEHLDLTGSTIVCDYLYPFTEFPREARLALESEFIDARSSKGWAA